MVIKKQTLLVSVIYDTEEIYAGNYQSSMDHEMFNMDGVLEWDSKIIEEKELTSLISKDFLKTLQTEQEVL